MLFRSAGATGYYLRCYDQGTGQLVINRAVAGAETFTPTTRMTTDKTYYWNVQAYNNDQNYSLISADMTFTLDILDTPTLTAPSGSIVDTTPEFSWDAVAGATGYYLRCYNQGTGQFVINTAVTGAETFTPTAPMITGVNYYWNVQAYNDEQNYSLISSNMNFDIQ